MNIRSLALYCFCSIFIVGWWLIFQPHEEPCTEISRDDYYTISNASYLEPISRTDLKNALCGDREKMVRLLIEWDEEADQLLQMGFTGIERLSSEEFRSAIHLLKTTSVEELKVIPQTHVAATILLAIAPKTIQAIPMGLRMNQDLYPFSTFHQIPFDCQSLDGEIVHQISPQLSFVASYSNPVFLRMLRKQQIPEVHTEGITTLGDLYKTIDDISESSKHRNEGKLLSLFLKSAFIAIDNRLHALMKTLRKDTIEPVLYLFGDGPFYAPDKNSLIGELIGRLGLKAYAKQISIEEIEFLSPKAMIIASNTHPRIKSKKIYLVNPTVQDSPTQFAALAYRDVASCLMDFLLHE